MNHNAAFFNTAAENPPRVLGLRLHPLQLGHLFILNCIESPFTLDVERMPDERDFLLAVMICASDQKKAQSHLKSFLLPLFFRLWLCCLARKDMVAHLVRFNEYLTTGQLMPEQKQELNAEELQSPGLWRLVAFLMGELNVSFDKVMATPVWLANALYAAHAEMKNRIKLVSERDHDLWEFAKQEDAKLLQEQRN